MPTEYTCWRSSQSNKPYVHIYCLIKIITFLIDYCLLLFVFMECFEGAQKHRFTVTLCVKAPRWPCIGYIALALNMFYSSATRPIYLPNSYNISVYHTQRHYVIMQSKSHLNMGPSQKWNAANHALLLSIANPLFV